MNAPNHPQGRPYARERPHGGHERGDGGELDEMVRVELGVGLMKGRGGVNIHVSIKQEKRRGKGAMMRGKESRV